MTIWTLDGGTLRCAEHPTVEEHADLEDKLDFILKLCIKQRASVEAKQEARRLHDIKAGLVGQLDDFDQWTYGYERGKLDVLDEIINMLKEV